MANRVIEKVKINGEALKQKIYVSGYSLVSLSIKIGVSDRQLRTYLKRNEMPPYMLALINKEIISEYSTSIVYVPICGKCNSFIKNGVSYNKYASSLLSGSVTPMFCPNCNSHFERIITPAFDHIMDGETINMFDLIS